MQVCWKRFANYFDVAEKIVPMEGDRFTLDAENAAKMCDENTIGMLQSCCYVQA